MRGLNRTKLSTFLSLVAIVAMVGALACGQKTSTTPRPGTLNENDWFNTPPICQPGGECGAEGNIDTDGDGICNCGELASNSDPNNPNSSGNGPTDQHDDDGISNGNGGNGGGGDGKDGNFFKRTPIGWLIAMGAAGVYLVGVGASALFYADPSVSDTVDQNIDQIPLKYKKTFAHYDPIEHTVQEIYTVEGSKRVTFDGTNPFCSVANFLSDLCTFNTTIDIFMRAEAELTASRSGGTHVRQLPGTNHLRLERAFLTTKYDPAKLCDETDSDGEGFPSNSLSEPPAGRHGIWIRVKGQYGDKYICSTDHYVPKDRRKVENTIAFAPGEDDFIDYKRVAFRSQVTVGEETKNIVRVFKTTTDINSSRNPALKGYGFYHTTQPNEHWMAVFPTGGLFQGLYTKGD